ncbi:MAG: MotA/TolQ/ExbB proton channel family protein [Planctomycetota bacterium]
MKKQLLILVLLASAPLAQDATPADASPPTGGTTFQDVAAGLQRQLDETLAELSRVREEIETQKVPLDRALNELEGELVRLRGEYRDKSLAVDTRKLDLSALRTDIETREAEAVYLGDLLSDYIRNFDSRLHIAERARYTDAVEAAQLATENSNLTRFEVFEAQARLLDESIARLESALGGDRFGGTAIGDSKVVQEGTFVLVGPSALFRSSDGTLVGAAEERLGSLEPTVLAFGRAEDAAAAASLVELGRGVFPFDATLGNAFKVEETQETIVEHARKGGVIMIPILGMAALAFLVAFYKWLRLTFVRTPSKKSVRVLLGAVADDDRELAREKAKKVGGPVGRMLTAGVEHLDEPKELIEEVLYERMLTSKVELHSLLPFIAICAAASPLLGLLGTVQGIIETFKQITVHGSGDVKMLSAGISKALITTEFGLIVAIPSLLLHAFLLRKARGLVNRMETTAIAFVNGVMKSRAHTLAPATGVAAHDQVRTAVREALAEREGALSSSDQDALADEVSRALGREPKARV